MLRLATAWFLHYTLIWLAAGVGWGLLLFSFGYRRLERKRRIVRAPALKICSAGVGLVEISGKATGPHVITSPLGRVDCFYYRSLAWQLKKRGKWEKVADETLHLPFYLEDSTEKMLIDPRGAELDLTCEFEVEFEPLERIDLPEHIREFLTRNRIKAKGKIKLQEYCLRPQDFLFALGTVSQNPGLDISLMPRWAHAAMQPGDLADDESADRSPEIVRLSSQAVPVPFKAMTQQQRIAAALAKAGMAVSHFSETRTAGRAAGGATAVADTRVPVDPAAFNLHPPAVLMKDSKDKTLLISWRSRRHAISLNWKTIAMILTGPAIALASSLFLIARLR
jgi:E3 Ubiquitin ligase